MTAARRVLKGRMKMEVQVTDAVRDKVRAELPEIAEIKDAELRNKVVEAWAWALIECGYGAISEMPGEAVPDKMLLKAGTQVDHLRGVTRLAIRMADEMVACTKGFRCNRDVVVAGGLLHDVGKPFEFSPKNRAKWKKNPRAEGLPAARHTLHGYHICRTVGLPIAVAHIAGAHSPEGELIVRSLECTIVHYADDAYWQIMRAGGLLSDQS